MKTAEDIARGLVHEKKTPHLHSLISRGLLHITESGEVVGKATDGVEITMGYLAGRCDAFSIESYLREYPTPDRW